MIENIHNNIGKAHLSSTNPLKKDWKVQFWYKNSDGKRKRYSQSLDLNQDPYVVNGIVDESRRVSTARLKKGLDYVEALNERLATTIFDIDAGDFVVDEIEKPFLHFITKFIDNKTGVTATTIYQYNSYYKTLVTYIQENYTSSYALSKINKDWIAKFLNHISDSISPQQRDNYFIFLNGVFRYCINFLDLDIKNPCNGFKKIYKGRTNKHRAIPASDILKSFDLIKEYDYHLSMLCKFVFYTLHRLSTITQIKYKNINWETGEIYLSSDIMKNHERMIIKLPPILFNELKEATAGKDYAPNSFLLGHDDDFIIRGTRKITNVKIFGKHITDTDVFQAKFKLFRKKRIKNNCTIFHKNISAYTYKHSGIVHLKDNSFSDHDIIAFTGHKDISILATYSKDYKAKLKEFPAL